VTGHPEDARLAAAGPREVTLYTRPGCHLCDEAKHTMTPLLREFGAALREVSIENDPILEERYGVDIPVIFIGARKAAKHRVDAKQFRRQLQESEIKITGWKKEGCDAKTRD
jgi:glutaredoxin